MYLTRPLDQSMSYAHCTVLQCRSQITSNLEIQEPLATNAGLSGLSCQVLKKAFPDMTMRASAAWQKYNHVIWQAASGTDVSCDACICQCKLRDESCCSLCTYAYQSGTRTTDTGMLSKSYACAWDASQHAIAAALWPERPDIYRSM